MREILFKAKRIDNGEWVEGYYFKAKYHWHKHGIHEDWIAANAIQNGGWCNVCSKYAIDSDTLCQYTGLTDKNGNKIWENDVLLQKTTEQYWCQWECMGIVKYGEHDWDASNYGYTSIGFYVEPIVKKGDINKIACGLNQVDINDEYYPIEVIGNIFDNPELLKGSEEE